MAERTYQVTISTVCKQYSVRWSGDSPTKVVKEVVRSLGGGPLTEIHASTCNTQAEWVITKPTELLAVVDLLGGTRDSRSYYKVKTRVDWTIN